MVRMAHTIEHPALQPLKSRFPEQKLLVGEFRDMVTVVVPREAIVPVATFLRDEPALRFDMLAELNGVDYLNYPGARHRFGVNYGVHAVAQRRRLWARVCLEPGRDAGESGEGNKGRGVRVVGKGG